MGFILGLASELFVLIVAVCLILYFGGYRTPKAGDEEKLKRFNELKERHGKKIVVLGVVLIVFTVFRIVSFLA